MLTLADNELHPSQRQVPENIQRPPQSLIMCMRMVQHRTGAPLEHFDFGCGRSRKTTKPTSWLCITVGLFSRTVHSCSFELLWGMFLAQIKRTASTSSRVRYILAAQALDYAADMSSKPNVPFLDSSSPSIIAWTTDAFYHKNVREPQQQRQTY